MAIAFINPEDLLKETEAIMGQIANVALFRNPQYQKILESWCAGIYGLGYKKYFEDCTIGINNSAIRQDVDFFLRTVTKEWEFQVVEVQDPGRKRGDEYKGFADGSIKTILYEPERGRIEGPGWLKDGVKKKASKSYARSERLNLLLYANFMAFQLEYIEIKEALAPFDKVFSSIWVLTSTHLCSLYSNSELGKLSGWGEISNISHYY